MNEGPAVSRMTAAENTPTGWIVPSGLSEFKRALCGAQNAAAFNEWRKSRFTQLLFLALQDVILHPGNVVSAPVDVPVQYGVTQGLAFAAQLVSDPSVLWPNVYGAGMENVVRPSAPLSERFSSPPDGGANNTQTTK